MAVFSRPILPNAFATRIDVAETYYNPVKHELVPKGDVLKVGGFRITSKLLVPLLNNNVIDIEEVIIGSALPANPDYEKGEGVVPLSKTVVRNKIVSTQALWIKDQNKIIYPSMNGKGTSVKVDEPAEKYSIITVYNAFVVKPGETFVRGQEKTHRIYTDISFYKDQYPYIEIRNNDCLSSSQSTKVLNLKAKLNGKHIKIRLINIDVGDLIPTNMLIHTNSLLALVDPMCRALFGENHFIAVNRDIITYDELKDVPLFSLLINDSGKITRNLYKTRFESDNGEIIFWEVISVDLSGKTKNILYNYKRSPGNYGTLKKTLPMFTDPKGFYKSIKEKEKYEFIGHDQ